MSVSTVYYTIITTLEDKLVGLNQIKEFSTLSLTAILRRKRETNRSMVNAQDI